MWGKGKEQCEDTGFRGAGCSPAHSTRTTGPPGGARPISCCINASVSETYTPSSSCPPQGPPFHCSILALRVHRAKGCGSLQGHLLGFGLFAQVSHPTPNSPGPSTQLLPLSQKVPTTPTAPQVYLGHHLHPTSTLHTLVITCTYMRLHCTYPCERGPICTPQTPKAGRVPDCSLPGEGLERKCGNIHY